MRAIERTIYLIDRDDLLEGKEFLEDKQEIEVTFEPVEESVILEKSGSGCRIRYLSREEDAMDPRICSDNLSKMVCFHKRYELGDKHSYENTGSIEGLVKEIEEEEGKIEMMKTLYLLDHSGLSISTRDFRDYWDSGIVGIVYVTEDMLKEAYGDEISREEAIKKAEEIIQYEVEEYDEYLRGEVYGVVVEELDEGYNIISTDSIWGYYGYKNAMNALKEV